MVKKLIFCIVLFIFLINFSLASGLKVVNQSIYNSTKLANQDLPFYFDLFNDESFSFYNISVMDNARVSFGVVQSISPGQILRINGTITGDESFNSTFKIRGYYLSQVG